MSQVAIVTGASSGIGKQTAIDLASRGYTVIGGSRHIESDATLRGKGIDTHNLDVTKHSSNQRFIEYVLATYGHIDVLINSAGYGSFGALEEVPLAEAQNQLAVNLTGIVDLIQLAIPSMRKNHSGRIINISSLAGQTYSALAGWYFISKHALETMSDVLRLELKPFGIDVIIVEPGITATNWANVTTQHMLDATAQNSPYRKAAEKQAHIITQATQTTRDVSRTIIAASEARKPKVRYQVRRADKIMITLMRLTSYKAQDRFAMRMLA